MGLSKFRPVEMSNGQKKRIKKTLAKMPDEKHINEEERLRRLEIVDNTRTCRHCNGTGEIEFYNENYPRGRMEDCERCKGTGRVYNAIKQT